jgi:hypothetical protein
MHCYIYDHSLVYSIMLVLCRLPHRYGSSPPCVLFPLYSVVVKCSM